MLEKLNKLKSCMRLILATLMLIAVFLLCFGVWSQVKEYKSVISQKNHNAEALRRIETDRNNNLSKLGDEYISSGLKQLFSENEFVIYSNSFYSYQLQINGVIAKSETISVSAPNGIIKVNLVETKKKTDLPNSIISLGSVTRGDQSDTLSAHISIKNQIFNIEKSNDGLSEQCVCNIPNLKPSDIITIELSDQISEKLGITSNILTVYIK